MNLVYSFGSRIVCIFLFSISVISIRVYSQSCYSTFIDSILSRSDLQVIQQCNRELSGEIPAVIGGLPYTIYSRYYLSPANDKAAQYIYEKFQSFGLNVRYSYYSATGKNVIAQKTGTKYPGKQFLICAHFDNITYNLADTVHGADDNATGICAVLETARLLAHYNFDYTLVFAVFDKEEIDFSGSISYADSAYFHGDSLLGVINLDMIGYDSNNDFRLDIASNYPSSQFADILISSCLVYQPWLLPSKLYNIYGSDQRSFWARGFTCSAFHESTSDLNPFMHTVDDKYSKLNFPYLHSIIKSAVAAMSVLGKDYIIHINHTPLSSSHDTTARIVEAVVSSPYNIAAGNNRPRLYYKYNTSGYSFTYPYYTSGNTYRFNIPGFPLGSTVMYYIALQDSAGSLICSSPPGSRGLNPPGTVPPVTPYKYFVTGNITVCSGKPPQNILAGNVLYDTIFIDRSKSIFDVNVSVNINHSRDEDISIYLLRNGFNITLLSGNNGGNGHNYTGTVFDDEADTLVNNGTAPFTGRYIPEKELNVYDNSTSYGKWILKITNASTSLTGQLVNWCISVDYADIIGINNIQLPVQYNLLQNYPNPFNPVTNIDYEIPVRNKVIIKVYDVLGKEVSTLVDEIKNTGKYTVQFDGSNFASGLYFYKIKAGDFVQTRKMVLVK